MMYDGINITSMIGIECSISAKPGLFNDYTWYSLFLEVAIRAGE